MEINKKNMKKKWEKPLLVSLDKRKTMGGTTPFTAEDIAFYNQFS